MPITPVVVADLTEATLSGTGVFDTLMRANKAHLEAEFSKNRIKGPEYATVYLGSMEAVLRASVEFLLQKNKSAADIALIEAQTALVTQQTLNAVQEGANLVLQGQVLYAQKCKLEAEFDLIVLEKSKVTAETALLAQKTVTEQAQTVALGVDPDSVIGKQKALYTAQTNGFTRDAEQKAAKLMSDTWAARRMTDEATVADATNLLNDATVGRAINKMLVGIGA